MEILSLIDKLETNVTAGARLPGTHKVMMDADGKSRLAWHTLRRYFVSAASTCMSLPSVLESAGHDSYAMWKLYKETDDDAVREDFKRFDGRMINHAADADADDVPGCTPDDGGSE